MMIVKYKNFEFHVSPPNVCSVFYYSDWGQYESGIDYSYINGNIDWENPFYESPNLPDKFLIIEAIKYFDKYMKLKAFW